MRTTPVFKAKPEKKAPQENYKLRRKSGEGT